MGLIEQRTLLAQLAPPLDSLLTTQLLDEFVSLERRFIQRDWEPAELDGGQFAEILIRILYHQDSGTLNRSKGFKECAVWIEDEKQQNHHAMNRQDAITLVKVLRIVYNFRSNRGAVHISPSYEPNHMDSKLVTENVRWCLNETLRIFWSGDREKVAKAIREILQFDVPCIGVFDDIIMVQRTDLTSDEEALVLLHYAGENGFTADALVRYSGCSRRSVLRSLESLQAPDKRQVVRLSNGLYRLTDLGGKRIRDNLADKLLLQ